MTAPTIPFDGLDLKANGLSFGFFPSADGVTIVVCVDDGAGGGDFVDGVVLPWDIIRDAATAMLRAASEMGR